LSIGTPMRYHGMQAAAMDNQTVVFERPREVKR
jgi:hypothetical protein